jgi:alkylation response protein AidB-like acyl-CoA dehydrogenase
MDFRFTPEQIQLRKAARNFAEKEIGPLADEIDTSYDYPADLIKRIAKAGFFAYLVPEDCGGKGISSLNICILREEFGKICTNLDETLVMQGLGTNPIVRFGNETQKKRFLTPLLTGEKVANFALTEKVSGSDVAGIKATAKKDGDYYILNGVKCYMSKPAHTDTSVVFAKTDPKAGGKGISAFIVDRAESTYKHKEEKLVFECNIGEMIFEDTHVPKANLLGAEGQGMRIAMTNLDTYRPTVGAFSLGMGERALSLALEYAKNRDMFGQKLIDFQVSQFKLAEMKIMLDAASLLVYRAAWLADQGQEKSTLEASAAKYYATEIAQKVVDQALQLFGGAGLQKGSRIEHIYRAVRAPRIYEGASEIQLLVIGRELVRLQQLEHDGRL